ncbi:peptidase S24/S26A/S26B [Acidovorax citrulli]|nr:peptidase S24/S26A/S26B [Paracidovorax citrulli]
MRPRRYPVISSVQAGEWEEIVDQFSPGDAEDWQDSPVDLGPNGFVLKLEGSSMTNPAGGRDNFPEGMYVHIHPGVEAQPGDYVVAKREADNKATFKKLVRVDGEQFLHAINPAWPKPYIKLEPGDRIIGKLKFAGWSF